MRDCCLLFLGLILAAQANAQSVRFVRTLKVVDANGRLVGKVVTPPGNDATAINLMAKVNDAPVTFTVLQDRIAGKHNFLYFNSTDCSGLPFTGGPGGTAFTPVETYMNAPGMTLYITNENGVPISLPGPATFSQRDYPSGNCSVITDPAGTTLFPAVAVTNFSDQFTPPFELR